MRPVAHVNSESLEDRSKPTSKERARRKLQRLPDVLANDAAITSIKGSSSSTSPAKQRKYTAEECRKYANKSLRQTAETSAKTVVEQLRPEFQQITDALIMLCENIGTLNNTVHAHRGE